MIHASIKFVRWHPKEDFCYRDIADLSREKKWRLTMAAKTYLSSCIADFLQTIYNIGRFNKREGGRELVYVV
jgi:hypothetical protein